MTTTKTSRWELVIVAVVCTALGLVVGADRFGTADGAADPDHPGHSHRQLDEAHVADHDDEHDEHDETPSLSPATLANLGVRIAPLERGDHVRTLPVQATVVALPTAHQPLHAPFGGRVSALHVERGDAVAPGEVVATIVRDPVPRPTLTLTGSLLEPAQERLHDAVLELRVAAEEVRIARAELERVRPYTDGDDDAPVLPRQRAIDLEYALARAQKMYEKFEHELEKHGLTEEQIAAIERGASLPPADAASWRRALTKNGLWSDAAVALYEALPDALREVPWATATIGELSAAGLATHELAAWIASSGAGPHFVDVGVLLLEGRSLAELRGLHELGALEPVVAVRAPGLEAADAWDVVGIDVKVGAHVEVGDALVMLHDAERLALAVDPVGDEIGAVLDTAARGAAFAASPVVSGAGPILDGLRIAYVGGDGAGEHAIVPVDNVVLAETTSARGATRRTWGVREGTRYVVHVPIATDADVFAVPAAALANDGPDTVVFVQRGDGFEPVPVEVVHRDRETAVLGPASALSVGDRVVQSGAFELALALTGGDELDAHAGHGHDH